ncbi:MAG: DUF4157 domain-containing protein [Coleofasciculus sp. C2-GNP5-27]
MYQPPQQKKSSWTPSTAQNKSKSSSKLGRFSIQPKPQQISPPPQEIREYSRESADRLAANVIRGIQAKEQEQAETSTVQRQYESPWAPTFGAPPPLIQSPASQLKGAFAPVSKNPIQRQCTECAKEEQEHKGEDRKEVDEISASSNIIQAKLTTGESGERKEPAANPIARVMSKPTFSAHTPQVQGFSPQENPMDIWARAQAIGPTMERRVDHRAQMRAMVQRAFEMGRTEAPVEPVQAKLTLGQPGDKYEQEADAVARTVVEQINAPKTGESVQRQSESPPFTPSANPQISVSSLVMRQSPGSVGEGASVSQDVEQGIQQAKGGGQGLDESVREPMEQAFGADFTGVKVHAGGNADQLNRSISARAFTTGQDIFFKQGEYNLGSRGGQKLLAHELTHVVQQESAAGKVQRDGGESPPAQRRRVLLAQIALGLIPNNTALIALINAMGFEVTGMAVGLRESVATDVGLGIGGGIDEVFLVDVATGNLLGDVMPFGELGIGVKVGWGIGVVVAYRISPRNRYGDIRSSYSGQSFNGSLKTLAGVGFSISRALFSGNEGFIGACFSLGGEAGFSLSSSYTISSVKLEQDLTNIVRTGLDTLQSELKKIKESSQSIGSSIESGLSTILVRPILIAMAMTNPNNWDLSSIPGRSQTSLKIVVSILRGFASTTDGSLSPELFLANMSRPVGSLLIQPLLSELAIDLTEAVRSRGYQSDRITSELLGGLTVPSLVNFLNERHVISFRQSPEAIADHQLRLQYSQ